MHQTEKIRVLIVDDHDLLRRGIAVTLLTCADISVVGEASNGFQALECCNTIAIDVILMDLVMPKMDGITAARTILKKYPGIQILALTAFDEQEGVATTEWTKRTVHDGSRYQSEKLHRG